MISATNSSSLRLAEVLPKLFWGLTSGEVGTSGFDAGHRDGASTILVLIDGLGWGNLEQRSGHARNLFSLEGEKIETVTPSTTAAALTTLTTGKHPLEHGFTGYRLKHPKNGLVTLLNDWQGIERVREWQKSKTLFEVGQENGVESYVVSKPAFEGSGFTEAVLTGGNFVSSKTIEERLSKALEIARSGPRKFVYVYIDELDSVGHRHGWESNEWVFALEDLDAAVGKFLRNSASDIRIVFTADHGMIDVPPEKHIDLSDVGISDIKHLVAGEPRFRHIYTDTQGEAEEIRNILRNFTPATLFSKTEYFEFCGFSETSVMPDVAARVGDVILIAQDNYAFSSKQDRKYPISMIGQHGGITEIEMSVPLLFA